MHSFIHPLQAAVPPAWESRSDWGAFKAIAKKTSENAKDYLPEQQQDIVVTPLMHDTPAEMAQRTIKDWSKGECEPIPGKTMPNIKIVERDFTKIYNKFISLGHGIRNNGLSMHGIQVDIKDLYDEYLKNNPTEKWDGNEYISLKEDLSACNY